MFHGIPQPILKRMRYLEELDARERVDGTPRMQRLRQVPPETGRFIALLAVLAPAGTYLEIGTSAGYSGLWLALACREVGRKTTTFESSPSKAQLARETFKLAGVEDVVELVEGDARKHLKDHQDISFCFLDAEKEHCAEYYEELVPRTVKGGLLAADNAIDFRDALTGMLERALNDERVDAQIVPIGKGVLVCRKL